MSVSNSRYTVASAATMQLLACTVAVTVVTVLLSSSCSVVAVQTHIQTQALDSASPSIFFPAITQENNEIFPSKCSTCVWFSKHFAEKILKDKIIGNQTQIIEEAQVLCQQRGLAIPLGLDVRICIIVVFFVCILMMTSD
jgi:hypothetical protein